MAKLNREDSERILVSVREQLPREVKIRLTRRGTLRIRWSWKRFEWSSSNSNPFGHISRRVTRDKAIAFAMRNVLHVLTSDLRRSDHCWPNLDYGPVASRTWIDGDLVNATVTDRHGTVLTFSPVPTYRSCRGRSA